MKENSYITFPDESATEEDAKNKAAQMALSTLTKGTNVQITRDEEVIKARFMDMISPKPNGIFAYAMEGMYRNEYNEMLPPNWQDLILGCKSICQEKSTCGKNENVIFIPNTQTTVISIFTFSLKECYSRASSFFG